MFYKYRYLFIFLIFNFCKSNSDLAIVGPAKLSDGIFRLSISWIEQLKNDIKIDFVSTGYVNLEEVKGYTRHLISKSINNAKKIKNNPANVAVLLSSPWTIWGYHDIYMPNSKIKIAYSMLEGTEIPQEWVNSFNKNFDAVVVPDNFLVNVYENSGVKIPIFVLPIALLLDDFLNAPLKVKPNKIFRFGVSASFIQDKNHETVLRAFAKTFKQNHNVELYLHGRGGNHIELIKLVNELGLKNVYVINKCFTQEEYVKFMASLDCYVLVSKGEGFSITPREAMALGIPCILSNNTAHKKICNSGLVEVVKSEIIEPAFYVPFGRNVGNKFNCTIEDTCIALQKVYQNYTNIMKQSLNRRKWAQQYDYKVLKERYLSLIKPKQVIFDNKNYIGKNVLMTNSYNLYSKYLNLNS